MPIPEGDDLSLWIGRVVRSHAMLEYQADLIHRFICAHVDEQRQRKSVVSLDQVIADCRRRVQSAADLQPDLRKAGVEALLAARGASNARNRVAHDMWLPHRVPEADETTTWAVFQRTGDPASSYAAATRRELDEVIEAHFRIERTRVRLSGLFMALHAIWELGGDTSLVPRYIAMMTDQFHLAANGDVLLDGERPS